VGSYPPVNFSIYYAVTERFFFGAFRGLKALRALRQERRSSFFAFMPSFISVISFS
jgi:hypothetical protein